MRHYTERYTELCDALGECKGTLGVVSDLRLYVKTLCCVPRHPAKPLPAVLATLPGSMKHMRKFLKGACDELQRKDDKAGDVLADGEATDESGGSRETVVGKGDEVERAEASDGSVAGEATPAEVTDGMRHLEHVMEGVRECGWPAHFERAVAQVLVAKGAVKAIWMHRELVNGQRCFEQYSADLDAKLGTLRRRPRQKICLAGAAAEAEAAAAAEVARFPSLQKGRDR